MSQFRATRNLYMESLHDFEFPLTYEAWLNADDEYKAVLLFVNFFDQIELAWYKERYSYGPAEEDNAVSEVNLYLIKNVTKIKEDSKRFTPGYIYRVAANCISCVGASQVDINHYKLEMSNEVTADDGIVDLFDLSPSNDDTCEMKQVKEALWDVIDKMGLKAQKVVNKLINPDDSLAVSRNKTNGDLLKDVTVSKKEYDEILVNLREALAPYADYFVPVTETIEGDTSRVRFIQEMDKLKAQMEGTTSEKIKRDCRKALKKMRDELAVYDMLQAGYSA